MPHPVLYQAPDPTRHALLNLLAALALGVSLATGCVGPPYQEPFVPVLTRPGPDEAVTLDFSILVMDVSGSIDREVVFPAQKALLESFVMGMPPGTYQMAMNVLGGEPRDQLPLQTFDRSELGMRANRLRYVGLESPLAEVFEEWTPRLESETGRAAIVIFSDGVPTRYGRYIGPEDTLEAARVLEARHPGKTCFHTIGIGDDPRGPELLRPLAASSDCGSYRTLASVSDAAALAALQRAIYIGPKPPPEAKAPRPMTDLDRDGVDDRMDQCARTPFGARVGSRGCWVIEDYVFETDSARIAMAHREALDAVVTVMADNPGLRVRFDGHTDDRGDERYNLDLSERRAQAVGRYLRDHDIAGERLEYRGFGARRPIAPNETPDGRRSNRRVELSVIDW